MIRIGMRWVSAESKIEDLVIRMDRMGVNEIERFEIGDRHQEIDYSVPTSAASPPPVAPGPRTANRYPGPPYGPRMNVCLGPGARENSFLGPGAQEECSSGPTDP